jgi:hypothetical protein
VVTGRLGAWRELARTFPLVRDYVPAEALLEPSTLDTWADMHGSRSARHVAAFLCGAWNDRLTWACGPFDLFAALASWDSEQRAAFVAWAANPRTF